MPQETKLERMAATWSKRLYSGARSYVHELIGTEISTHSRYFDAAIQVFALPHDDGAIFRSAQCLKKSSSADLQELQTAEAETRRLFLLNGNFNHNFDVEGLLRDFKRTMHRGDRLTVVVYNSYLRGIYSLANRLGARNGELPTTYFTQGSLENIAKLAGFDVTRKRPVGYIPFRLLGLGSFLNRLFQALPFVRWFGLAEVVMLRPVMASKTKPSISILVPARNERGNIEGAVLRLPELGGAKRELIFVEGHSNDGTWEEILRVQKKYGDTVRILAIQQQGRGKADAVRTGLAQATCDLVTILDADLTMPPELLPRFYEAYEKGLADFVNGSRLLYPMEGEAMRFLNWLGNIFFANALSFVLECPVGDSLCGTKLMARRDYERFTAWRKDFGDFDPFGDFELLFPTALLGLGTIDIPVRYRARTYGSTNIRRFRDGWILLKMTTVGLLRIRYSNEG
ncbi:MAG: glycosyltransferase family 2 protein [Bdellovibrionota bacterium]